MVQDFLDILSNISISRLASNLKIDFKLNFRAGILCTVKIRGIV